MPHEPITDAERQQIANLHGAGESRNQIAKIVGRSTGVVSKVADQLGLKFDRSVTAAATEAVMADAKAKRAKLAAALLDDAERLRLQLFAPCTVHSFGGKDNTFAEAPVERPPFRDQRDIMAAANTALMAALKLEQHDADVQGLAAVDAWLRELMGKS